MESSVSWFHLIVILITIASIYIIDIARRSISQRRRQIQNSKNLDSLQRQVTILQKEINRLNGEIKRVSNLPPVMIMQKDKQEQKIDTSPVRQPKTKLPPPPSQPPSEVEGPYVRVLEMMEQGYDISTIAKACNLSQTEVDMTVSLYRKPKIQTEKLR